MFETLQPAPPDGILGVMSAYLADSRSNKVDLGVGVYKDEHGAVPILNVVREAEGRLLREQTTKSYLGSAGDPTFNIEITKLVFGDAVDGSRTAACQTPGGSGALRILLELVHRANPDARIWIPNPSWPAHSTFAKAAGLQLQTYPYYDETHGVVTFDAMIAALGGAKRGDIVLLHGCCHNPTGADLTLEQWNAIADLVVASDLFPFVDIAYQGFGLGLEEDAAGLRLLAGKVPELAVATSCSKNFGLYRDRVGAALLVGRSAFEVQTAMGQLLAVARATYSMPPDHGAAIVSLILRDPELRDSWKQELEGMRRRLAELRYGFAEALRRNSNTSRFDFIGEQSGMFSRIGASAEAVARLRDEHAIYVIGDGRINVAGLPQNGLDDVAKAVVKVLGSA